MKEVSVYAAPATFPVSLDDARLMAKIIGNDEDAFLLQCIEAATDIFERETWSKCVTQTLDWYVDAFKDSLVLPFSPAQSITSITYTDTASATQTLANTVYELGQVNGAACVRLKYGQTWPTVRGHDDDICIRYVAGYGAQGLVPEGVKLAIKHLVLHWYTNRDMTSMAMSIPRDIPFTFRDLAAAYSFRTYA